MKKEVVRLHRKGRHHGRRTKVDLPHARPRIVFDIPLGCFVQSFHLPSSPAFPLARDQTVVTRTQDYLRFGSGTILYHCCQEIP
jgi:hypothetical protein